MPLLVGLALVELAAATLTTHAVARLDDRAPLLVVEWLHQFGAAIWIGGIPCFLLALRRVEGGAAWRLVGARFSRMSMAGVACILASGATMFWFYVGNLQGFYGTAYGVMVGAKIAMFLMLLALGGMNFLLVERLRADPATPVLRLRRFAEVEIGIGVSIFFAAASLTSVPPAVDLTQDRVSWPEIIARNTPEWPRLTSPGPRRAGACRHCRRSWMPRRRTAAPRRRWRSCPAPATCRRAMRPTSPGRSTTTIGPACSCVAIGLLALLQRAGLRWARHWPLLFLGLGVFLFFRSDPETWPLGDIGFLESFRDVEVLQHRFFVLLIAVFAVFEWRVRATDWNNRHAALVFPAALRRRRRDAADAQPRHRQPQGPVADRADAYAAGAGRHRRRLGALAGAAARSAHGCRGGAGGRVDLASVPVFCGLLLLGYREA